MESDLVKEKILNPLYYTDLVSDRVNKKLGFALIRNKILLMIIRLIREADTNYCIDYLSEEIRVTIPSSSFRGITVDRMNRI